MAYSNPIPGYTFVNGEIPYYVSIELNHWIPVSVMVFADNKEHALEIVKQGIKKIIEDNSEHMPESTPKLLTNGTITVEKIEKNQLYKISWAANDTICNARFIFKNQ